MWCSSTVLIAVLRILYNADATSLLVTISCCAIELTPTFIPSIIKHILYIYILLCMYVAIYCHIVMSKSLSYLSAYAWVTEEFGQKLGAITVCLLPGLSMA